jgi:hypothetical protein
VEAKPNCFKREIRPQEKAGAKPSPKQSQIVSKKEIRPQEK